MYLSFNRFSHHNHTYDTREVNDQENIKNKHYGPKTSNSFNRRLHHSHDYEQGSQISTPLNYYTPHIRQCFYQDYNNIFNVSFFKLEITSNNEDTKTQTVIDKSYTKFHRESHHSRGYKNFHKMER